MRSSATEGWNYSRGVDHTVSILPLERPNASSNLPNLEEMKNTVTSTTTEPDEQIEENNHTNGKQNLTKMMDEVGQKIEIKKVPAEIQTDPRKSQSRLNAMMFPRWRVLIKNYPSQERVFYHPRLFHEERHSNKNYLEVFSRQLGYELRKLGLNNRAEESHQKFRNGIKDVKLNKHLIKYQPKYVRKIALHHYHILPVLKLGEWKTGSQVSKASSETKKSVVHHPKRRIKKRSISANNNDKSQNYPIGPKEIDVKKSENKFRPEFDYYGNYDMMDSIIQQNKNSKGFENYENDIPNNQNNYNQMVDNLFENTFENKMDKKNMINDYRGHQKFNKDESHDKPQNAESLDNALNDGKIEWRKMTKEEVQNLFNDITDSAERGNSKPLEEDKNSSFPSYNYLNYYYEHPSLISDYRDTEPVMFDRRYNERNSRSNKWWLHHPKKSRLLLRKTTEKVGKLY